MKKYTKHSSTKCVLEIDAKQSREKRLSEHFQNGVKAIHLTNDSRLETLWIKVNEFLTSDGCDPFWEDSISTLSKNHISGRYDLGDMIRFFPSDWGHYARKMILIPDKKNKDIKVYPEQFLTNKGYRTLNQDVSQLAWDLVSEIYYQCLPKGFEPPQYAVTLQILKYPDSSMDFNKTFKLIKNTSTGGWTKLGHKLDLIRNKILIDKPFDKRAISKLYWHISKIPVLNLVLILTNKVFFKKYSEKLTDYDIIGPAHVDDTRAFSMLMGKRDAIVTEVYDNENWHEIELSSNSIQIFPGEYLNEEIGTKPTYHRYSLSNKVKNDSDRKPNISLLLGIVDAGSINS